MLSAIELLNLNTGKRITVKEINGLKQYLGRPSIYDKFLVFYRGEWTDKMQAEVYLYDIENEDLRKISGSRMAVQPSIWGKYVAWSAYSANQPETKNVVLYDMETGECKDVTDATPQNKKEYWAISISNGIVAWSCNFENMLKVYNAATNEMKVYNIEAQQTAVHGSWLTWRNPSSGAGTFMAAL